MSAAASTRDAEKRVRKAHIWARDEHDWYVEPTWCSRRLFQVEHFDGAVVDPACGTGRIVWEARVTGLEAHGFDLIQRTDTFAGGFDFLRQPPPIVATRVHLVCNPPFRHAEAFVRRALDGPFGKIAMLMPATWHVSDKRGRWLETTPLRRIWALVPRPPMPPGSSIAAGLKPGNGTKDFAWYVWLRGYDGAPEQRWLHRDETGKFDGAAA
jgi:hypothetical protein